MKTLRLAVSVLAVVLLTAGYLASQAAALSGQAADYAAKVDAGPIRNLSLALLVGAVILAFVPDRGEDP